MSPNPIHKLSPEQIVALYRWRRCHGRAWQRALLESWRCGRYLGFGSADPAVTELRGLRSVIAPGQLGQISRAQLELAYSWAAAIVRRRVVNQPTISFPSQRWSPSDEQS